MEYIQSHLNQNFGLAELAQLIHMSPSHFGRQFKQSTGVTPHQYLIEYRLSEVKRLLANRNLTIAEIAESTGFNSHSHLTRVFQKRMLITPLRVGACPYPDYGTLNGKVKAIAPDTTVSQRNDTPSNETNATPITTPGAFYEVTIEPEKLALGRTQKNVKFNWVWMVGLILLLMKKLYCNSF